MNIHETKEKMRSYIQGTNVGQELMMAHDYALAKADSMFVDSRGDFNFLSDLAKTLVVFGILIGMGIVILIKFRDSQEVGSTAYNEINNIIGLFSELTTWAGIVLIVMIAFIVLRYLNVFNRG